jgi:hypothetical protein
MVGWWLTNEWWIGKDLKENGREVIEEMSRHLPWGIKERNEKLARITGAPADMRTKYPRNTDLERYHYAYPPNDTHAQLMHL